MNKIHRLVLLSILICLSLNTSPVYSLDYPTFNFTVKNIKTTNPTSQLRDSIITFEVYMQQTNFGPSAYEFEYGSGQFAFLYNKAIQRAGENLFFGLNPTGNDLPEVLMPPTFQVDSVNGILKASGNGTRPQINFFISPVFPGTRILTFKLRTSKNSFQFLPLNLRIKLGDGYKTFLSFLKPYDENADTIENPNLPQLIGYLTDTISNIYSVESPGFVLPVELSGFNSSVNKNNVKLNWTTSSETNNQGFEIERSVAGSNEWVKSGHVSGNGNSTEIKNYTFTERVSTGHYNYRLKQIDFNGGVNFHSLNNEVVVGIPTVYSISQNYPNPFNPTTKIDFELPSDGKVSILLYDISGREVGKLVNELLTAGYHTVQFDGSNLSSGMYFYRIIAEGGNQNFAAVKKMIMVK